MKLLLVRHGHVDGIDPPSFRGRAEIPLTSRGQRQARSLAAWIATEWKPTAIITSPMERCVETGAAIASATGAEAVVGEDFIDFDYGYWSGQTLSAVEKEDAETFRRWFSAPHLVRIPGGDSLQDMVARAGNGFARLLTAHADETVVVVGHDSVNRALLLQLLDMPLSAYWRLRQDPTCLNEVDIDKDRISVGRVNETSHLRNPGSDHEG